MLAAQNLLYETPSGQDGILHLSSFPSGTSVKILRIQGNKELSKRLESMGVVVGKTVTILKNQGSSLLFKSGQTRLAFRLCKELVILGEQALPGV